MNDREIINMLIDAWEALPGGHYSLQEIEYWLRDDMAYAINKARRAVGRKAERAKQERGR